MDKTQPIQTNQVEENKMIKVKTIKPQNTKKSNQINSGQNENNLSGRNTGNPYIQNSEDEYEEIIFHDDFDKEYRNDVDDNFLAD